MPTREVPAEVGLDVHGASLAAFRDRALGLGIVTTHEINALLAALQVDPQSPWSGFHLRFSI
jgi:hypothetical protein